MNERYHEMVLEQTHASGVEEWYCPMCGRRFLVQWPPSYKMIVIKPGDQDTRHSVSKSNVPGDLLQVSQAEEIEPIEEFRLVPWQKWMEKVDFDPRWGKNE